MAGSSPWTRRSSVCPEAPVVAPHDFALLAADAGARDNGMRRAYLRMLEFYGFEWDAGLVRKAASWQQRFPLWARTAGSNDLRITRILAATTLCGLHGEAQAFLDALEEEVPQFREGDVAKPLAFWRDAVGTRTD